MNRRTKPLVELQGVFADAEPHREVEFEETVESSFDEPAHDLAAQAGEDGPVDEEFVEETLVGQGIIETTTHAPTPDATLAASGTLVHEPSTLREVESSAGIHESDASSEESEEGDASASHHVDPLPPSGFRLFGFGGKNK